MIQYSPQGQLPFEGFDTTFEQRLDPDNRWVKLAALVPWDELATIYAKNLDGSPGRRSVDIRMVLGAMIVKHKLELSDRETVATISENVYVQYFCGRASFDSAAPFDASLFVDIRKRMGSEIYDAFYVEVAAKADGLLPARKRKIRKDGDGGGDGPESPGNRGTLKVDATVADQEIACPTDLRLLNECRENLERIIDILTKRARREDPGLKKPRDYRRVARKAYLNVAKKKRKTEKQIRRAIKAQLQYVARDIRLADALLDGLGPGIPLPKRDLKLMWAIRPAHAQQRYMYDNRTHSVPHRIVSIHQPWVRPIVRGKDKSNVEFGAKISLGEVDGMARVDRLEWEAFNEAGHLKMQVENYRKAYGCWPEYVLADQIYLNRDNRKWLKARDVKIVNRPLGRPPKEKPTAYQKRKKQKLANERNHIEGKIGQGKYAYGLNEIKARPMDTSFSWINMVFVVMNLEKLYQMAENGILFLLPLLSCRGMGHAVGYIPHRAAA